MEIGTFWAERMARRKAQEKGNSGLEWTLKGEKAQNRWRRTWMLWLVGRGGWWAVGDWWGHAQLLPLIVIVCRHCAECRKLSQMS